MNGTRCIDAAICLLILVVVFLDRVIFEPLPISRLGGHAITSQVDAHNSSECPFGIYPGFALCLSRDSLTNSVKEHGFYTDYNQDSHRSISTTTISWSIFARKVEVWLDDWVEEMTPIRAMQLFKDQMFTQWLHQLLEMPALETPLNAALCYFMTLSSWTSLRALDLLDKNDRARHRLHFSFVVLALMFGGWPPQQSSSTIPVVSAEEYSSGDASRERLFHWTQGNRADICLFLHWLLMIATIRALLWTCARRFKDERDGAKNEAEEFSDKLYHLRYLSVALICVFTSIALVLTAIFVKIGQGNIPLVYRVLFFLDAFVVLIDSWYLSLRIVHSASEKRGDPVYRIHSSRRLGRLKSRVEGIEVALTALTLGIVMIYALFVSNRMVMALACVKHIRSLIQRVLTSSFHGLKLEQ